MKQATLPLNQSAKKTCEQVLLGKMDHVLSWSALVELIAPCYLEGKTGS